ncbi:MAG: class I SAM-dependent RNA methyltransferase [Oscillospiraceae bacterium]|jgi:23S rRNA (uracil1939-C5)-methyltransferase|nr:class I SAM-dependent RNA methyltransferase [Oscillospiraceae bacterium]
MDADKTEITISSARTHTVTVTGYGSGGEGIARLGDGRVVFVRNAAREDVLEVTLTKDRPRSAHAEISRILVRSPYRIEPDCPYYPECGGCDFRHITYAEELEAKLQRVNDALHRIGGLCARAAHILSTGKTEGYRNKAVLHSDGAAFGYYQAQSHDIIPIDRCLLLKDDLNNALKDIKRSGDITLSSGRNGLSQPLEEELDNLVFQISGFFQINTGAALLLYNKVREYAAMSGDEALIDLYCGVGAITLFVGRDAGYALGVEQNPAAVETARENARRNNLSHIEFICADASSWEANIPSSDCVIADPPRNGLSAGTLRKIIELSPKRIVYISCDPATLARDLRGLDGYTVKDICAVDMFPRTANVECCCLLVKT